MACAAWMYRFGNVIGARMTHGVIFDFIGRLRKDPSALLVRGDGRQEKNYFLVEECIDGMLYGYAMLPMDDDNPCAVFNLGTPTVTKVIDIAQIIVDEMGLTERPHRDRGDQEGLAGRPAARSFRGRQDSPGLGWKSRLNSDSVGAHRRAPHARQSPTAGRGCYEDRRSSAFGIRA